MTQFIKVCDSIYGNKSCRYYDVNPELIVELHIEQTQTERNVEATLVNGQKVIILFMSDIRLLVGEKRAREIEKEYCDIAKRRIIQQ